MYSTEMTIYNEIGKSLNIQRSKIAYFVDLFFTKPLHLQEVTHFRSDK